MRYAVALLLVGHGVAHLPGFLVSWQLASFPELPFRTTVLSNMIEVGTVGARVVGSSWLLLSLWFIVLGVVVAVRPAGWPQGLPAAVALSALLCVLGWPEAKVGLAVNGLAALGFLAARSG